MHKINSNIHITNFLTLPVHQQIQMKWILKHDAEPIVDREKAVYDRLVFSCHTSRREFLRDVCVRLPVTFTKLGVNSLEPGSIIITVCSCRSKAI